MQQIYLGWDIMDEYHNIIDHYQGYYYLHSLFQNTAQVKTFQRENSSCFEFSNPAKSNDKKGRLDWRTPVRQKVKTEYLQNLDIWGLVAPPTSLRYGLEIQRTKCGKHLPSNQKKKVWKGVGNIKRY